MPNNWYPDRSNFATHEAWDAHVQTLNIIYEQKAKLEKAITDLKAVTTTVHKSNVGQPAGGALNTRIGGFLLAPGQPTNGQTLRYNSSTGQFEFGI